MTDRACTGTGHGPLRDFGNSKIGEQQFVVREQDKIVGLDVAVDDFVRVSVCSSTEKLMQVVERHLGRQSAAQSIAQRLFPHRECHDEMAVDHVGILQRQNVGVFQFGYHPYLTTEVVQRGGVGVLRCQNFESDSNALDGIAGSEYGSKTAFAQSPFNFVFP